MFQKTIEMITKNNIKNATICEFVSGIGYVRLEVRVDIVSKMVTYCVTTTGEKPVIVMTLGHALEKYNKWVQPYEAHFER